MFVNKLVTKIRCNIFTPRNLKHLAYHKSSETNCKGDSHNDFGVLYNGHIPTTVLGKLLLTVGASVASITDPFRHDMVAVLGETTGANAAKKIYEKMLLDPEGCSILREKPRINSKSLNYTLLESLPQATLGYAYITFLKTNNITPDTRQQVHFVDDPELAYVIQRYREVHDLLHTLLGMPTNMLGEVAVKWVEAIQTDLPMCIAGAVFGPLRFGPKQRHKYVNSYLPWALNCGLKASFLMNVHYEKRWEQDLENLRKELFIPTFTSNKTNYHNF